jgi:RNA polymerase sigma-70 factor (sigma-E family)
MGLNVRGRLERGRDFDDFVIGRSPTLLRTAVLLVGDRAEAEDLVQGVFERLYVAWPRITDPAAYAHRALIHATHSGWRRRARRPETPLADHDAAVPGHDDQLADRDRLMRALAQLPPRQRAVIVLRYFEDLSEVQIAAALKCSTGTVKSHASRGLATLRSLLQPDLALKGSDNV